MQYQNIHLIYFSPTHTSAKIAYAIAEALEADTLSESDITHEGLKEPLSMGGNELVIVAVPVYGGRVAETDMPIAAGRPDKDDLLKASEFGSEILKKLDNVSTLTDLQPLEVKGNFPYKVKGPSTPQAPVTDEDLCTQCEYCIDVCPVAAISIVDDRMFSDPSLCIKCCACVKECPEGARTFDTPYTAMLHKNFSARREPELFI